MYYFYIVKENSLAHRVLMHNLPMKVGSIILVKDDEFESFKKDIQIFPLDASVSKVILSRKN